MKAKITLTDKFSGRSINLICKVENVACGDEPDKYVYNPFYLSGGQRRKIESFFGKLNAYYTSSEIVKLLKYTVWYNDNVETKKVAEFESLKVAKAFCRDITIGYKKVADGDNSYEGRSNNFRYEVYEGEPIETASDGEDIIKDAIYQTKQYYCK